MKQTPVINDYMGELVEKCATVKDPLSDLALDITRQCINVSLSHDGKEEVCPHYSHGAPCQCVVDNVSMTAWQGTRA